jgi:cupin 2 domain-containing protein
LKCNNVHIERIVSQGHTTPPEKWYDQAWDEWVIVLEGQAILVYEQSEQILTAGDYVFIPAHTKHRVEWTTPDSRTVWLAVHLYH